MHPYILAHNPQLLCIYLCIRLVSQDLLANSNLLFYLISFKTIEIFLPELISSLKIKTEVLL